MKIGSFVSKEVPSGLDSSDPRALISLVPFAVQEAILEVPQELYELTPKELLKRSGLKEWTDTDSRLRTSFWMEYERAQDTKTPMILTNIIRGVCSSAYFYQRFLVDSFKVAYMLSQPVSYRCALEEATAYGLERVREIFTLPLVDQDGYTDAKIARVILEAYQVLDMRLRGAVVQRTVNKNLNVNVETKGKDIPLTEEELDKRLAELEKVTRPSTRKQIIEVESEGNSHDG